MIEWARSEIEAAANAAAASGLGYTELQTQGLFRDERRTVRIFNVPECLDRLAPAALTDQAPREQHEGRLRLHAEVRQLLLRE